MQKDEETDDVTDNLPMVDTFKLGPANVSQDTPGTDIFTSVKVKELDGTTPVFKRRVTNEIKKYARGIDSESKKIEDTVVTGYNAFDVAAPPYNQDYLAKLYEVSAPHHAAVDAKASNVVGLGFTFVETAKTKTILEDQSNNETRLAKTRKKLERHKQELLELIDTWNEEDTFIETMTKMWIDYETTGNGYVEIGRKKNGEIGYVGHIPTSTVRIRRKRDGFVQIISNKAVFFRNFGDKETPNPFGGDTKPNELIHIKRYSPTNGFYGVPSIIAAKGAVAGNEFAQRFNLDYFEHKAVPRHVVILKGARLGTRTEAALLQFFETGLKGKNHRTLYIPLPADTPDSKVELKIETVEAGNQDSSFDKYGKRNRDEILMVHRTPISKVGLAEGVSLAVARDADKTYKEQVIQPDQKVLEKKFNKIIRELTDAYQLKFNEMTLTDEISQSQIDERYLKTGAITRNEVRARRGMPGLEGGDKPIKMEEKAGGLNEVRAEGNRERDAERSAGASDSIGEGRGSKGEGRKTP